MNPEYHAQSEIIIIAKVFRNSYEDAVAYVAVQWSQCPNSSDVNKYMEYAINHHRVLSMFDSWDYEDFLEYPNLPVIIV